MFGVDIGGTNTVMGLVQQNGHVVSAKSIPTKANKPAEDLISRIKIAYDAMYAPLKENYTVAGIGIGAPNANFYSGEVVDPPNLNWPTTPLQKMVHHVFNKQVTITNDANASALGELYFGAAKGMKNFISITLGTGLGSGIVVDGKLVYGHNGFAGELGHIMVEPNGRQCNCGKKGCLETYVSATGIVRTIKESEKSALEKSALSKIKPQDLTSKSIYNCAIKGDKLALEAFEFTANLLGRALANVGLITAPQAIIIAGGLAEAEKLLFPLVKERMEQVLLSNFKNEIEILASGIPAKNGAVLGAAALAWDTYNK